MVADAVNTSGTTSLGQRPTVPECNLSSDLNLLHEKGLFSDVSLCVANTEFKAHKAILAGEANGMFFFSFVCFTNIHYEKKESNALQVCFIYSLSFILVLHSKISSLLCNV